MKDKEKLERLVFESLGEASMCCEEIPKGTFKTTEVKEIGKALINNIFFREKFLKIEEDRKKKSKETDKGY